jgi:hypothetical protein
MAAATILLAGCSARSPNQPQVEMIERCAQDAGVAMARQHDVDGNPRPLFDERQQHELPVPHGQNDGVMMEVILHRLSHLRCLARCGVDQADVACQGSARDGLDQCGFVVRVGHARRT